jgi:hypothetical protein
LTALSNSPHHTEGKVKCFWDIFFCIVFVCIYCCRQLVYYSKVEQMQKEARLPKTFPSIKKDIKHSSQSLILVAQEATRPFEIALLSQLAMKTFWSRMCPASFVEHDRPVSSPMKVLLSIHALMPKNVRRKTKSWPVILPKKSYAASGPLGRSAYHWGSSTANPGFPSSHLFSS